MSIHIYSKALVHYMNEVDPDKFTAARSGLCIVISKFSKKKYLCYNDLVKDFKELKTTDKKFLGLRDKPGYNARIKMLEKAIKKIDPKWVNLF